METNGPSCMRRRLPHGVQDLFPEEAARRRRAEAALRDLFGRWAYEELIPPTFEYAETLAVGEGPDLAQAMYRFFDREGQTLALRADFTTQVARMAAGKMSGRPLPLRLCYIGSVFRYEEPQVGRQREFTQAGVELVGAHTPAADAEVVALAVAALEGVGVRDFQISLGQLALFRALTDALPPADLAAVRQAIDQRNVARLAAVLDAAGVADRRRALLAHLPDLVGGPEVLQEARAYGGTVGEAAKWLLQVYRLLEAYGAGRRVILDLGEVRGTDYYTGITFRGVAPGLGWPVLSGGRYDGLIGQFGKPLAAVGFGLGIERALLVQERQAGRAAAAVPHLAVRGCDHVTCLALAQRLREEGYRVEVDVLGLDEAELRAHAGRRGIGHTLSCRDGGTSWLLSDGREQRPVSPEALLEEMRTWNR